MEGMYGSPYLSLDDIADRLDVICSDISRMNFGSAKEHAAQLQRRVVRMTVHGYDVLLKEEQTDE